MRWITLTQGKFTLVDDEDFNRVCRWKWYAIKGKYTYYAARMNYAAGKKIVRMHRYILGLQNNDKRQVDHIDGNGLNNRRSNIRACTRTENQRNRKAQTGTSKFKGVNWHKCTKTWRARIRINKKLLLLGSYDFEIGAAKGYDKAAKKHFGEFAKLNFK